MRNRNRSSSISTKNDILSLLRRETLTAAELAQRLDVTRNAVIVPLRQLEADGLVGGQERRERKVGKPAMQYAAIAGREDIASRAYQPFAELLMQALPNHLSRDRVADLMREVGRKMATQLNQDPRSNFTRRLTAATEFADNMGADTMVETTETGTTIRSYSCPLGRAVRQEPCVCAVMASFFADVTGARVEEQCERGERLCCKFVLTPRPA